MKFSRHCANGDGLGFKRFSQSPDLFPRVPLDLHLAEERLDLDLEGEGNRRPRADDRSRTNHAVWAMAPRVVGIVGGHGVSGVDSLRILL